ncbi:cephalosporin hydroxylase [Rhodobacter sp. HX-7-19]|uniref:Cephalosporin hydroxylase n=1 Tax=Paragemmobacter kunshanensis TaxID=2583234 RepID=A0A6M1U6Q6_9RHOB|nr:CmcI family methyltransferase [Rhodobacter kunshanensis]NGQ89451.1 cephalosporin hydroxylase [Rhodobacter kunshanensis]
MTTQDDREAFARHSRDQSVALGKDKEVFDASTNFMLKLDPYDYSYLWTWMGVPIIQMPADILATQEVIWATQPDIIIETGVARGGSVLFMASLLQLIGKGQVIGVDIDIRAHNRDTIENHPMSHRVTLVEGGSTAPETLAAVKALIPEGARVMVILDSDHSRDHVLAECRAYAPLVTEGCYMVVADTMIGHVDESDAPRKRSKLWFKGNEPLTALRMFLSENASFEVDEVLNGKLVLSSSPGGYIRKKQTKA